MYTLLSFPAKLICIGLHEGQDGVQNYANDQLEE